MASPFTADQPFKENNVINESERDATPANDVGKLVQLESDGKISAEFTHTVKRTVYERADSPATWTKPDALKYIEVELWGGGGSGGVSSSTLGRSAGGGGGAYNKTIIQANDLGATETVTVGAGGAGVSGLSGFGNKGETSSFGSHISAYGGGGGAGTGSTTAYGGGGGGQLGAGANGQAISGGTDTEPGSPGFPSAGYGSPADNPAFSINGNWGGGGGIGGSSSNAGNSVFGGAGGGGNGGVSVHGGNGGAASSATGVNATDGEVPAGGGGNAIDATSGAGGDGRVIVTEFY